MARLLALALSMVLLVLFLPSCAAKKRDKPVNWDLSPEARLTYDYLSYLSHLNELQEMLSEPASPRQIDEVLIVQDEAAQALDRVIDENPSPSLYIEKANLYWNKQQIPQAAETLKQGLERFPGNRSLTLALANAYAAVDRLDDTVVTLRSYMKGPPRGHPGPPPPGRASDRAGPV